MKDDVDVVDHEIEDDGDVGATGVELSQPVGLDEHGLEGLVAEGEHCRIIALYVPDLTFYVGFVYQFDKFSAFFKRMSQWFLDEYVLAVEQADPGDFEVGGGRGDDVDRIYGVDQLFEVGVAGNLVLGDGGCCLGVVGIVEADEFNSCNFLPLLYVDLPQMTSTKYSYL